MFPEQMIRLVVIWIVHHEKNPNLILVSRSAISGQHAVQRSVSHQVHHKCVKNRYPYDNL
jgi:hypothetical protein